MADPERILVEGIELVRRLANDNHPLARRRRKRRKERIKRVLRGVVMGVVATFVIVPAMIAAGFLFGPRGVEGLVVAPLALSLIWATILYFSLRERRTRPEMLLKSGLAQLPVQTGDFIEQERKLLPPGAQTQLDAIGIRLEALGPQLAGMTEQTEGTAELRRLLGEELPELVRAYRKVPQALTQQPLYGGSTPERQLIEGLGTIDQQLTRLSERLAKNDLHAFATHQRYLELKYKRDEDK